MNKIKHTSSVNKGLVRLLGGLTSIFLFLQFFIEVLHIVQPLPLSNMAVGFSSAILHSWVIMGGFAYFLLAQIVLYTSYVAVICAATILISQYLHLSETRKIWLGVGLWLICGITVFLANQIFFPWSIFAVMRIVPHFLWVANALFYLLSAVLLVALVLTLLSIGQIIIKNRHKLLIRIMLVGLIVGIPLIVYAEKLSHHPLPTNSKPNIIIIGIDSLRPDFTGMSNTSKSVTPNMDKFLKNSLVFERAFTPLARTFPAWMSIMTSQNPIVSEVREELPDLNTIRVDNTLANNLRHAGYTTLYATDDRRFNHITPHIGFDKVIAPKTGFDDFVLGTFNDFPLSNVVMNTPIGRWLFPYSYANRSANVTYIPSTYVHFLNSSLSEYKNRPVFLAVHLTLPHWPFTWANNTRANLSDAARDQYYYTQSVIAADKQFGQVLKVLQKQQLLTNSIVFVISDHGQSLGYSNERDTDASKYFQGKAKLSQRFFKFLTEPTYGHGTDILNVTQYHIVFAARSFGAAEKFYPGSTNQVASLLDIKPTVLSYLHLPGTDMQGISLLPWLTQPNNTSLMPRDLYAETGFTLPGILVANPSIEKALRQGLGYFRVDSKTGSVVTKDLFIKLMVEGKQRAIIDYPWELACYPTDNRIWLLTLANMSTHQWTTDLTSSLAHEAHTDEMLAKLKLFFGSEYKCS